MASAGDNKISQELLEAVKNAEAVEAYRNNFQLIAERVASTASKRQRKGTPLGGQDEQPISHLSRSPGGSAQTPSLPVPPLLSGIPVSLPTARNTAPPPSDAPLPALSIPPLQVPPLPSAAVGHEDIKDEPQEEMVHSPALSDSEAEVPTGRRRRGASARGRSGADPQSRAEATKEKNRRAQQRFRHKQKSRMEALEAEVSRLRALLAEKGIDPGSGVEAETSTPRAGLTVDQMYNDLELWLEDCPDLSRAIAVRFLQLWLSEMSDDARRLHYKSIQKRHAAGKKDDATLWVTTQASSSHGGAAAAAGSGGGGASTPRDSGNQQQHHEGQQQAQELAPASNDDVVDPHPHVAAH